MYRDYNPQKLLDRLVKYRKNPLILSLKDIDRLKFKAAEREFVPTKSSLINSMKRLEKLGCIEWKRTGVYKFKPEIKIIRHKI